MATWTKKTSRKPRREDQRRALSHVGGPTETFGDRALGAILTEALAVSATEERAGEEQADEEHGPRRHVHGFHSYPARMHPDVANRLVTALSSPNDTVVDPFCGSGTTLVEARVEQRRAAGLDLNPLAARLTAAKLVSWSEADHTSLLEAAHRVTGIATERRKARAGASRAYPRADVESFAPHVLLELDGLRVGLLAEPDDIRNKLELVLSAILTKVSRRTGDSAQHGQEKRLAAGFPTRLFMDKTREWGERARRASELYGHAPEATVLCHDATRADKVLPRADLIVTSPPYAGVYDYFDHHKMRLRWLGLDGSAFGAKELGARRHLSRAEGSLARWTRDVEGMLRAFRKLLPAERFAAVLTADSQVGGDAVRCQELYAAVGERVGLELVAAASQARPNFHYDSAQSFRGAARREHLLLLRPRAVRSSRRK